MHIWFIALIVAVPLFVILWRRPAPLPPLTAPCFVRIIEPELGEEGRHLLIWSDPAADEYHVGLRGEHGEIKNFRRAEIAEWEG